MAGGDDRISVNRDGEKIGRMKYTGRINREP